jgi:hypothetical protein
MYIPLCHHILHKSSGTIPSNYYSSLHFHKQAGQRFSSASQNLACFYALLQTRTHPHNGTHDIHFRCKSLGNLPEECQEIPLFPMLFQTPDPKETKEQYKRLTATSSTSTLRKIKDV